MPSGATGVLVVVSGRVCYGNEKKGSFNETFIVHPDTSNPSLPNAYYIAHNTLRFQEDD